MFDSVNDAVDTFGEEKVLKMIEAQITHEWYKNRTADLKTFRPASILDEYVTMHENESK